MSPKRIAMYRKIRSIIGLAAVCCTAALVAGCAAPPVPSSPPVVVRQLPVFPPQAVMKNGDYEGFFAENQEAVKSCQDPSRCSAALFNLGFLYSFSYSPYHDVRKGRQYLEDLIRGDPESPWAYEARLMLDLMKTRVVRIKPKKRDTRGEPQPAETGAAADELAKTAEPAQNDDWEAERQNLEDQIRVKDETIKELNRQLERSRQIDLDVQKKERGLSY